MAHGADIPVVGIVLTGLALLLMAIAAIVVIVPAVVFAVEVLVVIVIVAAGVIGRLLFGRPWTIEARRSDGAAHEWQVRGWRASQDQMLVVADQLRATGLPAGGMRGAIHPAEAGD